MSDDKILFGDIVKLARRTAEAGQAPVGKPGSVEYIDGVAHFYDSDGNLVAWMNEAAARELRGEPKS
jgi:hypothetical protein